MMEAISRKKDAYKVVCCNSTEENKKEVKSMENKTISKAIVREGLRETY